MSNYNELRDGQEFYGNGYKQGYADAKAKYERPQGEWIKKTDDVGFISHICSECGAEIELEDPCDNKFCFNCGATMRKETNFKDYFTEQMKDPEFRKEYNKLLDNRSNEEVEHEKSTSLKLKGYWGPAIDILTDRDIVVCSICGQAFSIEKDECPNCHADMRGDTD